jgi:hypothetical protein
VRPRGLAVTLDGHIGDEMHISLEHIFRDEYIDLQNIYGLEKVNERIYRLNQIHYYTEGLWAKYINKIPGGRVKYLLIAESPPWSATGSPQYVLDPNSRSRTLLRALRGAF